MWAKIKKPNFHPIFPNEKENHAFYGECRQSQTAAAGLKIVDFRAAFILAKTSPGPLKNRLLRVFYLWSSSEAPVTGKMQKNAAKKQILGLSTVWEKLCVFRWSRLLFVSNLMLENMKNVWSRERFCWIHHNGKYRRAIIYNSIRRDIKKPRFHKEEIRK